MNYLKVIQTLLTNTHYAFNRWLNDHWPKICGRCRSIYLEKDTEVLIHRMTGMTEVCPKCYMEVHGYRR